MNYKPKHQVKVGGKMSEEGSDKVGLRLANSAMILAVGLSFAAVIWAAAQLIAGGK